MDIYAYHVYNCTKSDVFCRRILKRRRQAIRGTHEYANMHAYDTADWGDYSGNFRVPDTGGAQGVLGFLKQLDALSANATTAIAQPRVSPQGHRSYAG